MKKNHAFLLFFLLFFFSQLRAQTARLAFSAQMEGNQEVPAIKTLAKGLTGIMLDESLKRMYLNMTVTDLSSNITNCHIHKGKFGQNGAPVLDLKPYLKGNHIVVDSINLPDGFLRDLLSGSLYVNVHTENNPDGEVRGQLMKESDIPFTAIMFGASEVPAVKTNATGFGVFSLSMSNKRLDYKVIATKLSSNLKFANLYYGNASKNGTVVAALTGSGNLFSGSIDISKLPNFLDSLLYGRVYVNIHTEKNPDGEVRAQLGIEANGAAFSTILDGSQIVPSVKTDAKAVAFVTTNYSLDTLVYYILADGLSGLPTEANFQQAFPGANGGVIAPAAAFLNTTTHPNFFIGSITNPVLINTLLNKMLQNNAYINIRTAANPEGEIRGQMVPFAYESFIFDICGAQEVPPVNSSGIGTGLVSMGQADLHYMLVTNKISGVGATSAHIHVGKFGVNGAPLISLDNLAVDAAFGYADIDEAKRALILLGQTYINMRTNNYPNGELRGQIVKGYTCETAITGIFETEAAFSEANIYPNPVQNEVNLYIRSQESFPVLVQISDFMGRIVCSEKNKISDGENNFSFDLANYAAGFYVLQIKRDGRLIFTEKIIKH